jgi:ribosomal protein L11 methyltransferase
MKWLKLTIKTTTAATDIIISSLYDIGLEGAQIEDNQPLTLLDKERMFIDIIPDMPVDDGIAYLNFFVAITHNDGIILAGETIDITTLIQKVEDELNQLKEYIDIGAGSISVSETDDLDWVNNWKKHFRQFYIDDILIMPSWECQEDGSVITPCNANKIIPVPTATPLTTLRIDPGTAFGTGMHETTQLCIRQLRKHVKDGDILLDIGCGSGILAIVALMSGASRALATDLDPGVLAAVEHNCRANAISSAQFEVIIGNIITDEEIRRAVGEKCYNIVTANILTEVLLPLTPVACRCLAKGGLFITSGIINDAGLKEAQVIAAMQEAGMEVVEVNYQGEWVSVTSLKTFT